MQLTFNLEDIDYLKFEYKNGDNTVISVCAMKEKKENEIIAVTPKIDITKLDVPQMVAMHIICPDGLYKTEAELVKVENVDEQTFFVVKNPESLDYQQNRRYYRVLADYDSIYTVQTSEGVESFNAEVYDISSGGVSILMEENVITKDESSIVIFLPGGDIKSHIEFLRSEIQGDSYKLSFRFTDISERDAKHLEEVCVKKQLEKKFRWIILFTRVDTWDY